MKDLPRDFIPALRDAISEQMDSLAICRVTAAPDHDHDGDPILRISVIYDGAHSAPDPKLRASLTRHLQPVIEEHAGSLFPVIRFIDACDASSDTVLGE